jgi:hypothetical protein
VTAQPAPDSAAGNPVPLQYGHADPRWRRWWRWVRRIRWWTWILILLVAPVITYFWGSRAVWVRHDPGAPDKRRSPVMPAGICTSPDGSRIAFRTRDSVVLLDTKSGRELFHSATSAEIVSITHDGQHLVTAASDDAIRIFDMTDGRQLAEIPAQDHKVADSLYSLSKDGSRMIVRSQEGIGLWDCGSGKEIKQLVDADHPIADGASFTESGRFAAVWYSDKIEYFRAADGSLDHICPLPDSTYPTNLVGEGFVLTADQNQQYHWIQSPSGVEQFAIPGQIGGRSFQLTPDGQRLICLSVTGLTLVNTFDGKVIRSMPSPSGAFWYTSAMSADGRFIAAEAPSTRFPWSGSVTVFDTRTLAALAVVPGDVFEGSHPFSPDGSRFVISRFIGGISILDTATWKPVSELVSALPMSGFNSGESSWYLSDNLIVTSSTPRDPGGSFCYWSKRRPDAWWGVVVLPQFCLALAVTLLAITSFVRDIR